MVACGRSELHLHQLYFTLNFVITGGTCIITRVLRITYYAETKIMPHLKHVEYLLMLHLMLI